MLVGLEGVVRLPLKLATRGEPRNRRHKALHIPPPVRPAPLGRQIEWVYSTEALVGPEPAGPAADGVADEGSIQSASGPNCKSTRAFESEDAIPIRIKSGNAKLIGPTIGERRDFTRDRRRSLPRTAKPILVQWLGSAWLSRIDMLHH
jgi:hypothetical protein